LRRSSSIGLSEQQVKAMFNVKLQGLSGFKNGIAAASKNVKIIVDAELQSASADFVSGARRDTPIDQGSLKRSISYFKQREFEYSVIAQIFYSPFIEFGTKGKYRPIPGTEAIAAAFKGYKGGNFQQMLKAIAAWVKRKGIAGRFSVKTRRRIGSKATQQSEDLKAAWPIALSILRNGINPHPYFFKQSEIVWPKMVERIKRQIETATKVSVILPGDIKRPKIVTI
jgi:hypothetical protein